MPTSNASQQKHQQQQQQQEALTVTVADKAIVLDTNNNSNKKISNAINATSETLAQDCLLLVPRDTSKQTSLLVGTNQRSTLAIVPSQMAAPESILTIPGVAVQQSVATAAPPVPPRPPNIAAIKQQNQQHPMSTNNNNNNNNGISNLNNNNNISNSSINNNNNNNNIHNHICNNNSSSTTTTTTTTFEQVATINNHIQTTDSNSSIQQANPTVASTITQQPPPAVSSNKTALSQKQPHQISDNPIIRGLNELIELIKDENSRSTLTNEELIRLVKSNHISIYKLENFLGKNNASRCVEVRRDFYRHELAELDKLDQLGIRDRADALAHPKHEDLDYNLVNGACCENVIGHVKVPVGFAGPLLLDGEEIFVPLATTEGCLVASTCRGLSALRKSGGVTSRIRRDFMTRAPIIRFKDNRIRDALDNVERAIRWLNDKTNKEKMGAAFNSTSSHGKFLNYTMYPVSREIHIRFEAQTGDAMGMNMCSKGVESALKEMQRAFPTMEIVTLSGNMCTDKKAAGINWITGRGKAVECNAELPANVVSQVFKVSVDQLVDRWKSKVMIGSALAASIGGFNSQAANILTAIFIATGQDPAQNVTSSNCMLILEKDSKGSLIVCCTMPSIECGTVGGGTILGDQSRYLQMMGIRGPTPKLTQQQHIDSNLTVAEQFITSNNNPQTNSSKNNNNNNNNLQSLDNSTLAETQDSSSSLPNNNNNSNNQPTSFISTNPTYINTSEYTNARKLARIVCATVMAGELSLLAALTEGTLVKSHMRHNRSSTNVVTTTGSSSVNNLNQIIDGIQLGCNDTSGGVGLLSPNSNGVNTTRFANDLLNNVNQVNSCFGPLISTNNTTVSNHQNNSSCNFTNNNNHYLNNNNNIPTNSDCSSPVELCHQRQQDITSSLHDQTRHISSNNSYGNHDYDVAGNNVAECESSRSGGGSGGGGGASRAATSMTGGSGSTDNVRLC